MSVSLRGKPLRHLDHPFFELDLTLTLVDRGFLFELLDTLPHSPLVRLYRLAVGISMSAWITDSEDPRTANLRVLKYHPMSR